MMDKWFIKELALENGFKLKQQPNGEMDLNPYVYEFASALVDPTYKVISELEKQRNQYKAAFDEWIDKTDWVQTTCHGSELGLHRADALAMRIEKLEQERDQLKSRNLILTDKVVELKNQLASTKEIAEDKLSGVYVYAFSKQTLAEYEAEVIEQFVAAVIQCIKAVDPEIGKHKNCLSIAELKAFNIHARNTGVSGVKSYANQLRQKAEGDHGNE